MNNNNVTIETE